MIRVTAALIVKPQLKVFRPRCYCALGLDRLTREQSLSCIQRWFPIEKHALCESVRPM
ncbi:hypothetical protein D3C85_1627310 [compost metagenome]